MKVYICLKNPHQNKGGVFIFNTYFVKQLSLRGYLVDNPADAEIIFINSCLGLKQILKLWKKYPHKIYVHRVDGPISLYQGKHDYRDDQVKVINNYIADGTVFQSAWSKNRCIDYGLSEDKPNIIINNVADDKYFNNIGRQKPFRNEKIRIIAVSWSSNFNKGFRVYEWMDNNIDFDRFDMIFVGNSPIIFKNIKLLPPCDSPHLSAILKSCDIYITASRCDPCSNSLIEAMSCGIPCIALNQGGHPELIKSGGILFNNQNEIPEALNEIIKNYSQYAKSLSPPSTNYIISEYIGFFQSLIDRNCKLASPKFNLTMYSRVLILIGFIQIKEKYRIFFEKIVSYLNSIGDEQTVSLRRRSPFNDR